MVRRLKHHEQKLLRKVDFLTYKSDNNHRAATVRARYHLTGTLDYEKYNRLAGSARQLAHKLAALDPSDPFRKQMESQMLDKFFDMGILKQSREQGAGLSAIEKDVTVSAFARRRLGVVMKRLKMAENVATVSTIYTQAVKYIEQGHVRVGTEVITDSAFLVTRNMEDFVTWVDSSKVKRHIMEYRDTLDDFELL
ncbi:Small subunit (SSU) processome component [Ascosphaera acerosa]|nr:Small subunit (SSU) processome component [Ascosphaera acerosa]